MRTARTVSSTLATILLILALGAIPGCGRESYFSNAPGYGRFSPPPILLANGLATDFPDLLAQLGGTPGTVELTFTAPDYIDATAQYEVYVDVPHLNPDMTSRNYTGNRTPVALLDAVAAAGTAELLTIDTFTFEPGQTYQFAVRAVRGTEMGAFSHSLGLRVPDAAPPAPPAGAILVSAPGLLDQDGATYVLTGDIVADGTAFTITGRDITLDLAGFDITYGGLGDDNTPGIYSEFLYDTGSTRITNGTITQSASAGGNGAGIEFRGGHDLEFDHLTITTQGDDAHGIIAWDSPTGNVRVHHCDIAVNTTVVSNRSYPGVAGIWLGGVEQSCEVDHNRITKSPQWGIKVQGQTTNGYFWIHHNLVEGTETVVANGYMIGVHKPMADVFENTLRGASRGIHVDGQDNFGNDALVHDNHVEAQDQLNPEFPTYHWTHGIKLETARRANVYNNHVRAMADVDHAEAIALDISTPEALDARVMHNVFTSVSDTDVYLAKGLSWSGGPSGTNPDVVLIQNVFTATDRLVHHDWDAQQGPALQENYWMRDLSKGAGSPFLFEHFAISDMLPSFGTILSNSLTSEDINNTDNWAGASPYQSDRRAVLRIRVLDGTGAALEGATVAIENAASTPVASGATNDEGFFDADIRFATATFGPTISNDGPFVVMVTHPTEGSHNATATVTGPSALVVTLGATPSDTTDGTPPSPPASVTPQALSSRRIVVRWPAADDGMDGSGVVHYVVYADGTPVGVTRDRELVLGGLEPATSYNIHVVARDAAGNESATTPIAAVSTGAEDAGP